MTVRPPNPTDRAGITINDGDAIAYAVSDGYLELGVVDQVLIEYKPVHSYSNDMEWKTRLKVRTEKASYGTGRSNLTKMTNVIVLTGEAAKNVKDKIEASWVDTGL